MSKTPPQNATPMYQMISTLLDKPDLYKEVKEKSIQKAISFIPKCEASIQKSNNPFLTATKIAVAGNVIDLASEFSFDLEDELSKVFDTDFSHDDFIKFKNQLNDAKNIVILGDNVGEHIFDFMFVEVLKELYPHAKYSYFVRGKPIINDVTMNEALACGFNELCELVDSGVDTPGFVYARATSHAKILFDRADVVISKGMGNYECLSPSHRENICFLLKVKCEVVANS